MILVTGGTGLLGRKLIEALLEKGERVRAMVHKSLAEKQHPNLDYVNGNLLDVVSLEESLEGIHEVYHCAAFVSYAPGMVHKLYKVNVEGTANLVNTCIDAGIRKLIHVSSVSALPGGINGEAIHEQHPWNVPKPGSNYGRSKYLGEMEVWRGMAEGLNAAIVNPSIILGEGDWEKGSASLFKNIFNEFPWYSNGITGFVDVQDVVMAMILLMDSDIANERFIISAENRSFQEVFNCMAEGFGKRAPRKKVSPFLASVVWRWEKLRSAFSGKEPVVTRETARMAFKQTHYSNEKFLRHFPKFSYRPLQQTIAESCAAFQQKLNTP